MGTLMGETLSFKVFLRSQIKRRERKKRERKDDRIKENVRRFLLDRECADLGNLKLKISELFPEITDKEYFLSWTDADNDNVKNVKKHKRIEHIAGRDDKGMKSKKKTYGVK